MKQKRQLYKIILSVCLFVTALIIPHVTVGFSSVAVSGLLLLSYVIAGYDVVKKAGRNILRGRVFDENFLMTVATFGAVALGQYSEAVGVMLFYQVGELFQSYAVNKSRRSVAALMDIRPDSAHVKKDDKLVTVRPEEVNSGELIVVKPGERIPLDGVVISGHSALDTSALTGEAMPREVCAGGEVLNGCINLSAVLEIKVTREYSESTVARILDLVENAAGKKAKVEQFITQFARVYTPAVVVAAVLIAVMPPLLMHGAAWHDWIYRALTFLVISCPCALVISVPLSFFGGIGAASRHGILVKGSNYLQALAQTEIVVFDKTGTLTNGCFSVTEVSGQNLSPEAVLELAAYAGAHSSHPVSVSIRAAWDKPVNTDRISEVAELPARGVRAVIDGKQVLMGNSRLMSESAVKISPTAKSGTVVYVAIDGEYAGRISLVDEVKPDAAQAIANLKKLGIRKTVMLTGDNEGAASATAKTLGIDNYCAGLLPGQKVEKVECLMAEKTVGGKLVFVGDGINDAPVLARADIGIAMGGVGSDAAVEAADVVLMTDEPSKIAGAIKISKQTLTIVKENIVFALGVKFLVLAMGAAGMATMWDAVFADVGVSVIAILNAVRALRIKV